MQKALISKRKRHGQGRACTASLTYKRQSLRVWMCVCVCARSPGESIALTIMKFDTKVVQKVT